MAEAACGRGYPAMVPAMVLAGVGVSTAMPAVQTRDRRRGAPVRDREGLRRLQRLMRQLGGAFGIAILSAVFTAHGGFTSAASIGHGFRAAMIVATAISVFGALAGADLQTTPRRQHPRASHPRDQPRHPPPPNPYTKQG